MTTPLNNKKGTTLVELMVCLVLLALFGVAAVVHFLWVGSPPYAVGCAFIALIAVLRHTPRFCVAEVRTVPEKEEGAT